MKAILVLGHGSPKPEGNTDLPEIAARLATRLRDCKVAHAFLRHGTPTIEAAVAALADSGARELVIQPYFLGRGGHIVSDLPKAVAELEVRFPEVAFTVTEPLGVHDGLVDTVIARILGRVPIYGSVEPPEKEHGYVHVYTGRGKGKTTSAIGLAVRAAGAGFRVFFAQFLKSGRYSEVQSLRRFPDRITLRYFGTGHFVEGRPTDEDRAAARTGYAEISQAVRSNTFDLIVLDEANVAITYDLISVEEVLEIIRTKPEHLELVITGRNADPRLVEAADLVTEMKEIKHYYKAGVPARRGIEK